MQQYVRHTVKGLGAAESLVAFRKSVVALRARPQVVTQFTLQVPTHHRIYVHIVTLCAAVPIAKP